MQNIREMQSRPPPHILADQLTLSQPRGADYAHQIVCTGTPGFSDFPTALHDIFRQKPTSDLFVQME